jgi:hypothetical protein
MGVVGTRLSRTAVVSGSTRGRRRPGSGHPLLGLQRTAGNQAVAALVQRRTEKNIRISTVALARIENIYEGKCDAVPKGAQVRRKWSRGLMGKDVSIIFECGPKSFGFSTFVPYFGDRFPWGIELVDGGTAWVKTEISNALDDINADIDDAGSRFWGGYHVVVERLAQDLGAYCHD